MTKPTNTCPECGPHGNKGRVLLLENWYDCTLCRPTATEPAPNLDVEEPEPRWLDAFPEGTKLVDFRVFGIRHRRTAAVEPDAGGCPLRVEYGLHNAGAPRPSPGSLFDVAAICRAHREDAEVYQNRDAKKVVVVLANRPSDALRKSLRRAVPDVVDIGYAVWCSGTQGTP